MIVNSINKIAAYKSIYVTSSSDVKNNIQTDISFAGIKGKNLPLSVCLLGALTLTTCALPKWNWMENVRVLASNSQNVTAEYGSRWGESYSEILVKELQNKRIKTIEEANNYLSQRGYNLDSIKFHPLESKGCKLNIFNKDKNNKDRFLLIIFQNINDGEPLFKYYADEFSKNIQEIYKIPKKNIVRKSVISKKDLINDISLITNKINKLKNKSNAELLIAYFGHGNIDETSALTNEKIEGSLEGVILNTINESEVKQIFKEKIGGVKTLFMLDTCYAGAWIADNAKQSAKGKLKETNYINQVRSKAWKMTSRNFARINRFA